MRIGKRGKIVLGIVAALLALRIAAPFVLEYYLNEHRLADLGEYTGEVKDVDLALWRGAYRLEEVHIEKTSGTQRVDFLKVPVADISLSWRALLKGRIRSDLHVEAPELNFVDGEDPQEQQTGTGFEWDPEGIIDFVFEKITIRNGTLAFRNFTSDPPVNLQATHINLTATNLTNIADEEGRRVATLEVEAKILQGSDFSAKAEFDPFEYTSFLFACEMTLEDLTQINDFARAYGNLDFKSGHGEMVMELEAKDSMLTGYIKPAFKEVDIFNWQQDVESEDANPFQALWEGIAGNLSALFSNQKTDALATRIDISGELPDEASMDTWAAVWGVVSNAFVETINTNFEHITPLTEDVKEDIEE